MPSLQGMKVLDLTQHLSGPYCTMILGDLGAEVLKIEKVEEGDDQRKLGPFVIGRKFAVHDDQSQQEKSHTQFEVKKGAGDPSCLGGKIRCDRREFSTGDHEIARN